MTAGERLFFYLWDISQKNKNVRAASVFISKASRPFFFIAYSCAGVFLFLKTRALTCRTAAFILVPLAVIAVSLLLRRILKRPRPSAKAGIVPLIKTDGPYSRPSNHAASSAAITAACMAVSLPLGIFLFSVALLTGVSRVMTGAHYPFDVAAGWLLGAGFGVIFLFVK